MNFLRTYILPLAFIVLFALLWLGISTLLGSLSGWYGLMGRYPDRTEPPMLALKNQSGRLGMVRMSGVLHLSVCSSGVRIGIMRLFGPLCRDLFVPWASIRVSREDGFFARTAILDLGSGRLSLPAEVADRLARAAGNRWPETGGPFPEETDAALRSRFLKQWLAMTTFAATFFVFAPLIMAPASARPPVLVAILFPAVVFGVSFLVQYLRRRQR